MNGKVKLHGKNKTKFVKNRALNKSKKLSESQRKLTYGVLTLTIIIVSNFRTYQL